MGKKIAFGLIAVLVLFLGYVALQPADYVISREMTMQAPVDKVFPYLNNSKLAGAWSPWQEEDPQASMTYTGPDAGVGSRTSWDGGEKLGTGSATIVESIPNQKVAIKLDYQKPFQMTQDAEYLVKTSGGETTVTWLVRGKNSFMGRIMCVFMDMDKMVGGMFEKGLTKLKGIVEKP
ncbi:MAG: SRPBCC family protein [Bacteriovoracia bacterium]